MRTKNVPLQVLESTCSWKRVMKRFKDIFCSFFVVDIYTIGPQASQKWPYNYCISLILMLQPFKAHFSA